MLNAMSSSADPFKSSLYILLAFATHSLALIAPNCELITPLRAMPRVKATCRKSTGGYAPQVIPIKKKASKQAKGKTAAKKQRVEDPSTSTISIDWKLNEALQALNMAILLTQDDVISGDKNAFYSSLSIARVLSMLAIGAKGETEQQLRRILRLYVEMGTEQIRGGLQGHHAGLQECCWR